MYYEKPWMKILLHVCGYVFLSCLNLKIKYKRFLKRAGEEFVCWEWKLICFLCSFRNLRKIYVKCELNPQEFFIILWYFIVAKILLIISIYWKMKCGWFFITDTFLTQRILFLALLVGIMQRNLCRYIKFTCFNTKLKTKC